jgi:hypothetical protein
MSAYSNSGQAPVRGWNVRFVPSDDICVRYFRTQMSKFLCCLVQREL